jgi:hypothetical protein
MDEAGGCDVWHLTGVKGQVLARGFGTTTACMWDCDSCPIFGSGWCCGACLGEIGHGTSRRVCSWYWCAKFHLTTTGT